MRTILNLKLSDKKRVYEHAVHRMETDLRLRKPTVGLCWYVGKSTRDLRLCENSLDVSFGIDMKVNFPEVYKYRPVKRDWRGLYWFLTDDEGTERRIKILRNAIKNIEKRMVKLESL